MNFVHERTIDIERESVADLIRDLRDESMIMIRQQIELAKTETTEKVSYLVKNTVSTVMWSAVLFSGFLFLLAGLTFLGYVGLLSLGVAPSIAVWLMPLITGAIVTTIAGLYTAKSVKAFSKVSAVPKKTMRSIKEDQVWIKNRMKE